MARFSSHHLFFVTDFILNLNQSRTPVTPVSNQTTGTLGQSFKANMNWVHPTLKAFPNIASFNLKYFKCTILNKHLRVKPISVIWVSSNNWPHPLIAIHVFSLHIFPRSRPDILRQMRYAVKHCIAIVLHCLYRKFQLQLFKSVILIWFWEYYSLLLIAKSQPESLSPSNVRLRTKNLDLGCPMFGLGFI